MKILRFFLLLLSLVLLSGCGGPIYGQFMKLSEGLKSYEVVRGDITDLKAVKRLLVVGPFLETGDEHHMCTVKEGGTFPFDADITFITKHNDAQRLAKGFEQAGLFDTELYLEVYYDRIKETTQRLKTLNSSEIKKEFALRAAPEMILLGVVRKLDHRIAPLRGVIVDAQYELEFYNPDTQRSIMVNVKVSAMFNEDMAVIIQEMKNRMAAGN